MQVISGTLLYALIPYSTE